MLTPSLHFPIERSDPMQNWRLTGADAHTGEDQSIELKARDEAGAREAARMMGMLVATVEPLAPPHGPPLDYRHPSTTNAPASAPSIPPAPPTSPAYAEILHGASLLGGMASVVQVVGSILLAAGGLGIVFGLIMLSDPLNRDRGVLLIPLGIGALAYGIGLLIAAAFLRMQASIASAVRDIARNSFDATAALQKIGRAK